MCACARCGTLLVLQAMADGEALDAPSAALTAFEGMRNVATISFNDPKAAAADGLEYNNSVVTNLRNTLESVKAEIAKQVQLGLSHSSRCVTRS